MHNNIVILYAECLQQLDDSKFAAYLALLPQWKRERIGRFRRWQDAHASLLGNLLLLEGLKYLEKADLGLNDVRLSSYNRPYFDCGPDFNISHSGQYVVCALSVGGKIGVDVEQMAPLDINDFSSMFTPVEWGDITCATVPVFRFYEYWTQKEAIVKADGKGLSIDIKEVAIADSLGHVAGKTWHLREVGLDTYYKTYVASEHLIDELVVQKIVF